MKRLESTVLVSLTVLAGCLMLALAIFFVYRIAERRQAASTSPAVARIEDRLQTAQRSRPFDRATQPSSEAPNPVPTNTLVVPRESINERLLQDVEDKMAVLRNLMPRQPVPKRFLNGDQLREELGRLASAGEDALDRHELLYSTLGLIGDGDDLDAILAELNARSTSGFYSADDKQLYIVSDRWNMGAAEEMTFAHEFTHAMQDQYYDLNSLDQRAQSGDARLAIRALVEGDATLAMALYAFGNLSQGDVDEIAYQAARIRPDELAQIPPAVGRLTLFPYESGLRFVQTLYAQGSSFQAVDAAFAVPPLSTEQVLHPEKYAQHPDVPRPVALPGMDDLMAGSWREVDRGILGEFLLGLHLEQRLESSQAWAAVAGWGGDSYSLLVDGDGRPLLVVRVVWDTPEDAVEFFRAYSQLATASGPIEQRLNEPARAHWRLADSEIYVSYLGQNSLVVIAPDAVAMNRALAWFPGY